jgi:transposase, IS30 family
MSYVHLTERERYVIYHLSLSGFSLREIGRRLLRSHTSISRELKRNGRITGPYVNDIAHHIATNRKSKTRHSKRKTNKELRNYIERKLALRWSPQQISERLKLDYPAKQQMRISSETIYLWIYSNVVCRDTMSQLLRTRRPKRKTQRRASEKRGQIVDRVSIYERPEVVDTRERIGDWEGDTIVGQQGTGVIVTHVERKSRYLIAGKLPSKEAKPLTEISARKFSKIPKIFRLTLTVDNGKEFADFKNLEKRSQLKVYFAEPYSSWQRGCNENTNGLLRQYFPKGTSFKCVTDSDVAKAVNQINNRPRKSLNYQTPAEVMKLATYGAL